MYKNTLSTFFMKRELEQYMFYYERRQQGKLVELYMKEDIA